MYVILPDSYNLWATFIVWATEYPNFLEASCCKVEVVKGAEGDFFAGFFSKSDILYSAEIHLFRNFSAPSLFSNRLGISPLKTP